MMSFGGEFDMFIFIRVYHPISMQSGIIFDCGMGMRGNLIKSDNQHKELVRGYEARGK